jgi:PAS domain S-box-containing protein
VYANGGKILYVNPAAVKALGYDADMMIGMPVLSYVAEESRERVSANMAARHELGEIPVYELNLVGKDGLRRSVIVKGTQIQYRNTPATLLLLIDITRQKTLEDQLTTRAAELQTISTAFQQANKKLMLLTRITRHDINNQLTVILGYLALMEKKKSDPALDDYFLKVTTAAQRISSMIRFTREYEDIGISVPAWQDAGILTDIAAKDAPLGEVRVINDLPAGTEVFADPLIVKVFYNLMDNAVRYGGKITTIRFYAKEDGDDLLIVCEDDGDGVARDEKELIFEHGFGKNTGLGLALSREILDITDITIRENGEPGTGARFEIRVPRAMWRISRKGA